MYWSQYSRPPISAGEEPLDACFHVVMVHRFAPVGLFDATTDAGTKAHILFDQVSDRVIRCYSETAR